MLTGYHAIEEVLSVRGGACSLYYSKENSRINTLLSIAKNKGIPVQRVSPKELEKLAQGEETRGVLLIQKETPNVINLDLFLRTLRRDTALVLLLDGITDPHNLGAVLRSAAQFNADLVVVPSNRSIKDSDIVSRTSAGASIYVPVTSETNLVRSINKLKKSGFWVYGADMGGTPVYKTKFSGKIALVLGSEGKGMRDLVEKSCDFIVSIPTTGKIDSLNISVAAGILLYEIYRQTNV